MDGLVVVGKGIFKPKDSKSKPKDSKSKPTDPKPADPEPVEHASGSNTPNFKAISEETSPSSAEYPEQYMYGGNSETEEDKRSFRFISVGVCGMNTKVLKS